METAADLSKLPAVQRRALSATFQDVRDVWRRSPQHIRCCDGAAALGTLMTSAIDGSSNIVREDLIADLIAREVSLPEVEEFQ